MVHALILLCLQPFRIWSFFTPEETGLKSALNGFSFRSVGPAFMSGRIADIAIDPTNENVWYVAVGSGGTWKTMNAGTTWTPLTDEESLRHSTKLSAQKIQKLDKPCIVECACHTMGIAKPDSP